MATRLFVGNLPENASENDLRSVFSSYGEITALDLKTKTASGDESKKFAFVSLASSNHGIESCIKHFASEDFNGNRLYVTRARESFLERLQREREQALKKETEKHVPQELPKIIPPMKINENLNPKKRKHDTQDDYTWPGKQERREMFPKFKPEVQTPSEADFGFPSIQKPKPFISNTHTMQTNGIKTLSTPTPTNSVVDKKKHDSEIKRIESMKKKRLEFKEKQKIIKTGLTSVDKIQNKKIVFTDNDAPVNNAQAKAIKKTGSLFDGEDSGDDVDFAIKEQFEGKKGQKVLELQSRYKSDKRFNLDERFIEEDKDQDQGEETENVELEEVDEKNKQLNILEAVLGIPLKRKIPHEDMKNKPKLGMLRFDPSQPEHAKFLAPVEPRNQELTKKGKNKSKEKDEKHVEQSPEEVRPEVSKEQFYNVSETLKEAIAQSNTFSLRSLFGNNEAVVEESQEDSYIPLDAPKKSKMKNPLETKDKNPFIYDSSESENEDEPDTNTEVTPIASETKAVWKENLFFSDVDQRLKEGLTFFNSNEGAQKERRELKSLVKKRIYNKERKNQMFQKKIGGKRKTMKKSFRRKT